MGMGIRYAGMTVGVVTKIKAPHLFQVHVESGPTSIHDN